MSESRVPPEEWAGELIIHNLPRPDGLIEVDTLYDIGAGIRPQNWYRPRRHICVEPHPTYAERLRRAGYTVVQNTALDFLRTADRADAIYLLDVIEHMEKAVGREVVRLAEEKASKQVVIYTPVGFMEQDDDAWGLDGEYWQTHRSGWLPEEFPEYATAVYGAHPYIGFYAVLTK